eukprot:Tbor_TRINITY_DN3895_c0_g1::TRINITY_DN3895_c0_g1_i1::g.5701::m.5701/K14863/YTM1, WDR12; ribosome biogenesis protein YTM1
MQVSEVSPLNGSTSTGASIPVKFFTTTFHAQMPDQTFTIPLNTLPQGLNEVINTMLSLQPHVPFDFLINEEFITATLERFIRRRAMSYEETLMIEYTPAMQTKEGSKLPHDDWVSSVRSPVCGQSNVILTGAYDRSVRLWIGEECVAVGNGHSEAVKEIALHPNAPNLSEEESSGRKSGKKRPASSGIPSFTMASSSKDGSVVAWNFNSNTNQFDNLGSVKQHVGAVDTLDISPDGKWLATGSWDHSVRLFEWEAVVDNTVAPEKKTTVSKFDDHSRPVLSVRFSPSQGNVLYSTGMDGSIKVWDCSRTQLMGTLNGEHAVNSLACKPESGTSDLLLVGCTDNRIRMYDSRQKNVVKSLSGHRQWVYGVTWLWRDDEKGAGDMSNMFASSSEDATVRVWDTRCLSAPLITQDRLHTDGVLDVTYCGNNEIASGGKDNKTKTFSVEKRY